MTAAPSAPPLDDLVPLRLPSGLRLTAEQFAAVCEANGEAVLELDAAGQIIQMTLTGGDTGARNGELIFQLKAFVGGIGGWQVFDSSTGFRLPDGSVLSPDASLVRLERWRALSPEQQRSFPPLCPDLVVELASSSDQGPLGLSAQLGWLLIPAEQAVEVWPAQGAAQRLEGAARLDGGTLLPGLQLDLTAIWQV
jgi:Uma2 family endonuclease